MLKKLCVLLLVLFAFSVAKNEATLAYTPFPTEGLGSWVNSVDTVSKYSFAPSTIYYNGAFHQFYCSTGNATDNFFNPMNNANLYASFDHIRYRTSKDGYNWSAPRIVMTVNKNNDEQCACDPSVVKGDDGYWYMLYDGNDSKYGVGVFLARALFIQGPYFRYLGNNEWEDVNPNLQRAPKMLMHGDGPNSVVGQQTVVYRDGYFHVWFRDDNHTIRHAQVNNLTGLDTVKIKRAATNCHQSKEGCKNFVQKDSIYEITDVRFEKATGKWAMWVVRGFLEENMRIMKLLSDDGTKWEWVYADASQNLDSRTLIGPYNYIHNIGVSGDEHGWITDGMYLISFSAPHPGTDDAGVALHRSCADMRCKTTQSVGEFGYDIATQLDTSNHKYLIGEWSMWQELVGGTSRSDWIKYPDTGFVFPEGVKSESLEYFTGDFDGDGISDLGAFERSTSKWYIRSSRHGEYIHNGDSYLPGLTERSEIIVGDFDGDGKTDVGVVNRGSGKWYIRSSVNNEYGINHHTPSSPNYIPWGWQWDLTAKSGYKIVVGDYDGDGIADRAVYNAPYWYIIPSMATAKNIKNGVVVANGSVIPWGWNWLGMQSSHAAVSGDFDGDGITDRAIYGTNDAKWYVLSSRLGETSLTWRWEVGFGGLGGAKQPIWGFHFYLDLDAKPYAGDYDGDGVTDLVQVNASKGMWRIYGSSVRHTVETWNRLKNAKDPVILVGDFDGDGKADKAFVDRRNQHFYVISSKQNREGINVEIKSIKELMEKKSLKKEGLREEEGPKPEAPVAKVPLVNVSVVNRDVSVANVPNGAKVVVFDLNGKNVFDAVSNGGSVNFRLPSYGKFIVRAGAVTQMLVAK